MSKISFCDRIISLEEEAANYIKDVLSKRGSDYQLIDPATYEDGMDDEVYELPRGWRVDKYSYFEEHAIVSIDYNGKELVFKGIPVGEAENEYDYNINELSATVICQIADLVKQLEK